LEEDCVVEDGVGEAKLVGVGMVRLLGEAAKAEIK